MYLQLSLDKVKKTLIALGFEKTTSKRFIRYQRSNKGVELNKYFSLVELNPYAIVNKDYTPNDLQDLRKELEEAFKGALV